MGGDSDQGLGQGKFYMTRGLKKEKVKQRKKGKEREEIGGKNERR